MVYLRGCSSRPVFHLFARGADLVTAPRGCAAARECRRRWKRPDPGSRVHRWPSRGSTVLRLFAALGLILAAVGLYGVVSDSVGRREREIGIRMALGAERGQVLKLVLRDGLRLSLWGGALGLLASLARGGGRGFPVRAARPTR
jgi:predicted lysophospholipase L1 biosynthesis ABC-type transport system permease subunit